MDRLQEYRGGKTETEKGIQTVNVTHVTRRRDSIKAGLRYGERQSEDIVWGHEEIRLSPCSSSNLRRAMRIFSLRAAVSDRRQSASQEYDKSVNPLTY